MANNSDEWIADIASYVRKSFGNSGRFIEKGRKSPSCGRSSPAAPPWTIEELRTSARNPSKTASEWKLTASHNAKDLVKAIDGNPATRWDTHTPQVPGMWVQIELPQGGRDGWTRPRHRQLQGRLAPRLEGRALTRWQDLGQTRPRRQERHERHRVPLSQTRQGEIHPLHRTPAPSAASTGRSTNSMCCSRLRRWRGSEARDVSIER
jgi:hypothetical protein